MSEGGSSAGWKGGSVWIFGYGSLCWRPDFSYLHTVNGCIKGWRRVFWQGSTDHRGVPEAPGRVVTLVASPNDETWGVAFLIAEHDVAHVLANLDYREKGGYMRAAVTVHCDDNSTIANALVYVGTSANPNYRGPAVPSSPDSPADIDAIARQVATAIGPSGRNSEYVSKLAQFMRRLNVHDPHLFAVEAAMLAHLANGPAAGTTTPLASTRPRCAALQCACVAVPMAAGSLHCATAPERASTAVSITHAASPPSNPTSIHATTEGSSGIHHGAARTSAAAAAPTKPHTARLPSFTETPSPAASA